MRGKEADNYMFVMSLTSIVLSILIPIVPWPYWFVIAIIDCLIAIGIVICDALTSSYDREIKRILREERRKNEATQKINVATEEEIERERLEMGELDALIRGCGKSDIY